MYMVELGNDKVHSYTLSTPWNIGTATHDNVSFDVSFQDVSSRDIFFSQDGTKMYVLEDTNDRVYSYTLT